MNCKEAIQTLDKKKEQNRAHQKTFLAVHKDDVNLKRREKYAQDKLKKTGKPVVPTSRISSVPEKVFEFPTMEFPTMEPVNITENVVVTKTKTKKSRKPSNLIIDDSLPVIQVIPYKFADSELVRLHNEGIIKSESSLKTERNNLKQILRFTNCNELVGCIKDYKTLIDKIINSKQRNGEPYSINSIKSMLQTVLKLITLLKIDIPQEIVDEYVIEFELYKLKSEEEANELTKVTIPTFDEYLQLVKSKYGENSKLYVVVSLFRELKSRDNFDLIVSPTYTEDKSKNWIIVPKTGTLVVKINKFKTSNKHPSFDVTLSSQLSKQIRDYIDENNVMNDSYLFGIPKLTDFISKANKKLGGYRGGVNLLRKMIATDDATPRQQVITAKQMKHSNRAHKGYTHGKKNKDKEV